MRLFGHLSLLLGLGLLGGALHLGTGILAGVVAVNLHELGHVELGRLQDLSLADVHVLERVDAGAHLLDLLADHLGDELQHELLEVAGHGLARDDLRHLLADLADLGGLGVASALGLVHAALGEADDEDAKHVVVGGLDIHPALDEREPLADQRPQLVGGEVHPVEVRQQVLALHVLALEQNLAERLVLILVEVRKGHLENAPLEPVGSDLGTLGAGHKSLADLLDGEHAGGFDVIPVLLREDVDGLLLATLLALGHALVLTDRHLG
mmetsp:Transcript_10498/g.25684  ORF Transcript_10498/g.25684 Transcript_10498/m.25684 type:complete len:267 (+) Transcript_10498:131-931(+)